MPDVPDEVHDRLDRESGTDEEADSIEPCVGVPYQNVRRSGRTVRPTSDSRPDEVFYGLTLKQKKSIIRSSMFLKEKPLPPVSSRSSRPGQWRSVICRMRACIPKRS